MRDFNVTKMALADVCGFDIQSFSGKSRLGFDADDFEPTAKDAILASQSFVVPRNINVSQNNILGG